eukprot:TRINITY_DN20412_c0_g1_i1.p1 TRINITY_DN20412_c0_g1~~TRINITY_DN20412_c0_g1_i1.p1  ORF type:complete len:113 (+),score=21.88 TRINITY_DN20412_c0_g1_i1:208-546(+)
MELVVWLGLLLAATTVPQEPSASIIVPQDSSPASGAEGLPASAPDASSLDMSQTILEKIGPLVIHKDGTSSRVADWGKMDEFDRQRTLRIITARNKKRLQALKRAAGVRPEL